MANSAPKRSHTVEVLAALVFGFFIIGLLIYSAGRWEISSQEEVKGQPAPEVEFEMGQGKDSSISKHKGTVILINFWASWCAPCMEEMPSLRALENHFADKGLLVLAFNVEGIPGEQIQAKLSGEKLPKNLIFNVSKEALRPFNITSIPLSVLINKKGTIEEVFVGPQNWTDISMIRLIESILRN